MSRNKRHDRKARESVGDALERWEQAAEVGVAKRTALARKRGTETDTVAEYAALRDALTREIGALDKVLAAAKRRR